MTDKLRQAAEMALENLEGIVNSNWRDWEELASPEEFERWVKSLANHSAEALRQVLEQDNPSFDRTASHMAGEYVDTAQQEPVALKVYQGEICYMSQDDDQSFGMWCPVDSNTDLGFPNETKFYTASPKREWVELTNDEVQSLADTYLDVGDGEGGKHYVFGDVDFARAIEAKLKEKNNG